jgi:hypothetical protein
LCQAGGFFLLRELAFMDFILLRLLFVALLGGVCYFLHPFGLTGWVSAGVGAGAAGAVIVFELRVRALSLRRLIGAVTAACWESLARLCFAWCCEARH